MKEQIRKNVWKGGKSSPLLPQKWGHGDQEMKAGRILCQAKPLPTLFSPPSYIEEAPKIRSHADKNTTKKLNLKLLNPCLFYTGQFHWGNELLASSTNSLHPPTFIFLLMTQFGRYTWCVMTIHMVCDGHETDGKEGGSSCP